MLTQKALRSRWKNSLACTSVRRIRPIRIIRLDTPFLMPPSEGISACHGSFSMRPAGRAPCGLRPRPRRCAAGGVLCGHRASHTVRPAEAVLGRILATAGTLAHVEHVVLLRHLPGHAVRATVERQPA